MLTRRSFLKDMLLLCAAPAIVKIESIMPVKVIEPTSYIEVFDTVNYNAVYSLGTSGNPVALTKENILEYIVKCGEVMEKYNIPPKDRWVRIPDWMLHSRKWRNFIKREAVLGNVQ